MKVSNARMNIPKAIKSLKSNGFLSIRITSHLFRNGRSTHLYTTIAPERILPYIPFFCNPIICNRQDIFFSLKSPLISGISYAVLYFIIANTIRTNLRIIQINACIFVFPLEVLYSK